MWRCGNEGGEYVTFHQMLYLIGEPVAVHDATKHVWAPYSDRTGGKCAEGRTAQRQVDRRENFDFVSANISRELRGVRYL